MLRPPPHELGFSGESPIEPVSFPDEVAGNVNSTGRETAYLLMLEIYLYMKLWAKVRSLLEKSMNK